MALSRIYGHPMPLAMKYKLSVDVEESLSFFYDRLPVFSSLKKNCSCYFQFLINMIHCCVITCICIFVVSEHSTGM